MQISAPVATGYITRKLERALKRTQHHMTLTQWISYITRKLERALKRALTVTLARVASVI